MILIYSYHLHSPRYRHCRCPCFQASPPNGRNQGLLHSIQGIYCHPRKLLEGYLGRYRQDLRVLEPRSLEDDRARSDSLRRVLSSLALGKQEGCLLEYCCSSRLLVCAFWLFEGHVNTRADCHGYLHDSRSLVADVVSSMTFTTMRRGRSMYCSDLSPTEIRCSEHDQQAIATCMTR